MAATTTVGGHVARALDFVNKDTLYFGIGKSTPWQEDDIPEPPDILTSEVQEVIGYKKVEHAYLVVPDDNGDINYRDSRWRIVPPDQALAQGARWVYVDTYIRYTELPIVPYRVVCVISNLLPTADVAPGKTALLPNEVLDAGIVEVVDNRGAVNRQVDQREQLSMVIEF